MDVVVTVERVGAAVVAAPCGDVDALSSNAMREHLIEALDDRPRVLVLDLSETSFLDSTGLGVLVAIARRARLIKCAFCLAAPSPLVGRVLQVTSLDKAWSVYPTVQAALDDQAASTEKVDD